MWGRGPAILMLIQVRGPLPWSPLPCSKWLPRVLCPQESPRATPSLAESLGSLSPGERGEGSRSLGLSAVPFTLHGTGFRLQKGSQPCPSRQPLPGGTLSMPWTSAPPGSGASLRSRFEKKRPRKLKTDLSPCPVHPGLSQDTAVLEEPPSSRCHLK